MESSSTFSMERWDLAPGEPMSQRSPPRALHGARTPLCPLPTLDTEGFDVQNAFSEDCSPADSMAEYGLAPGEVRSQGPSCAFYGLEPLQCPRPTLDTQEFENNIESGESSDVEDTLACWDLAPGEYKSQGPALDPWSAPQQFYPPSLETQQFENRVIPSGAWLVKDSLECWDSGPGEARSEGLDAHCNNLESRSFPASVVPETTGGATDDSEQKVSPVPNPTPFNCIIKVGVSSNIGSNLAGPLHNFARKSSLPDPRSPQGDSRKSVKQVKLEPTINVFDNLNSLLLPVPLSGRSTRGECYGKVPILRPSTSSTEEHLGVVKPETFGLVPLSPSKHTPPTPVPSTIFDIKPPAKGFEDNPCRTVQVRRSALVDITNSTVAETKSPKMLNSKKRAFRSPTNSCRNAPSVASTSRNGLPDNHEIVFTSPAQRPAKNGSESNVVVHPMNGTEVDARNFAKKTSCRAQAKVQTMLHFHPVTSQQLELQPHYGVGTDGWRCPKAGKIFAPTLKQRSLDRWTS